MNAAGKLISTSKKESRFIIALPAVTQSANGKSW
jgi:hypothetical protein